MSFLKTNTKKIKKEEDDKLVGIYIPKSHFHYLNLYCTALGVSKNSVIAPLIAEWVSSAKKSVYHHDEDLCDAVAKRAIDSWQHLPKGRKRRTRYAHFYEKVKMDMTRKKLCKEDIETILKKIVNEAKDKS